MRGSTTVQEMPSLLQLVGDLVGEVHHPAERHDGDVVALAGDVGLAERDRVGLVRDLDSSSSYMRLVLEEDHRIVVADRLDQEALGLVGVAGSTTFRPGCG